jgi:hypothetical protein
VTYQRSFNGWTLVSSTTNSRTLEPNSGTVLPSSVSVTPSINGVVQTTETSTVSRSNFNPTIYQISGDTSVCDIGIYSINNLPSTISITAVNSSNPNIATVSLTANGDIEVIKVSDGLVTISATLQNPCGQTDIITKENIQVGIPASIINNAVVTGSAAVCGTQTYTYTLSGASHPCVDTVNWTVSPNLTIVSQSSNSVTVTKDLSITQNAGLITASIGGSTIAIEKGVCWVG